MSWESLRPRERLPSSKHVVKVVGLFAAIWGAVVLPVLAWRGLGDVLSEVSLFFTKAAFVTFGGAYAVLAYIADNAVGLGWLAEKDMLLSGCSRCGDCRHRWRVFDSGRSRGSRPSRRPWPFRPRP